MSRLSISVTLTLGILSTAPKGPFSISELHVEIYRLTRKPHFHDTRNPGPTDTRLSTDVPSEHEVQ